jgi:hypothetical protein
VTDDLEQQLGDKVADGKISVDDADTVRIFAQFLSEAGPVNSGTVPRRWLPYLLGEADGPIDNVAEAEALIETGRAKLRLLR